MLATAEESADRLTGLVDNLLDSSRLATGAVEPNIRPVGYDEVVAMRAVRHRRPARWSRSTWTSTCRAVLADAGLLERVVANVVDNALRHGKGRTTDGELPVAVRASAYGGQVELRVVDHGKGLPQGPATPCSRRSSGSATGTRPPASAWGCPSPRGSPRRWVARFAPRTRRAVGSPW